MSYIDKVLSTPIKEQPIIMAIETSCDETAVAIIKNGKLVIVGSMEEVKGNASLESVFLELEAADD